MKDSKDNRGVTLGERLQYYRKKLDLRQEDVAKYLNVHRTTYNCYENDRTEPDLAKLRKLAELFKINEIDLITNSVSRSQVLSDVKSTQGHESLFHLSLSKNEVELIKMIKMLNPEEQTVLVEDLKKQIKQKRELKE